MERLPATKTTNKMTAKEYQEHGFRLSLQVQQAEIMRAENAVYGAYLAKTYGDKTPAEVEQVTSVDGWATNATLAECVANLAFLYLAQKSILATRSGGKVPNALSASTAGGWDNLAQAASDCALSLKRCNVADEDMDDICGIYFKSNYFYN